MQIELGHVLGIITLKVNRLLVPCVPNFFYSFMQIFLKLHWCFGKVLKMCYLHVSHDTKSISSDHHLRCGGWLN